MRTGPMLMYTATVEVATKAADVTDQVVDELMATLAPFHAAVGSSPRGWLEARLSLPAETLVQATMTALSVVEAAAGAGAIAVEVMTEDESAEREGFTVEPELVDSATAAEILGVSQARVRQYATASRLQAVPGSGRNLVFTRSSVEALAGKPRTPGRPRKTSSTP